MMRLALIAAFCTLSLVATASDAKCSGSDRVVTGSATCVHTWNSRGSFRTYLGAQSRCPRHTVVVKWDLADYKDITWYLKGSKKKRARTVARLRTAYCCSDLGACNVEDTWDNKSCKQGYRRSAAAKTCFGARITYDPDAKRCTVFAYCRPDPPGRWAQETTIAVSPKYVADIINCDARFSTRYRGCSESR